jgi:hypothetical protein
VWDRVRKEARFADAGGAPTGDSLTPGTTKAIHGGGFAPTSGGGGTASPSIRTSDHSDFSPGSAHGGSVSRGSRSRRHPRSRHGSHGRP